MQAETASFIAAILPTTGSSKSACLANLIFKKFLEYQVLQGNYYDNLFWSIRNWLNHLKLTISGIEEFVETSADLPVLRKANQPG